MTRVYSIPAQWTLFAISIVLMGLWFLRSPFRADERPFFADNFGLDSRKGVAGDGQDSMIEAWAALKAAPPKKLPHQLKNLLHEWVKEWPKRAAKFLSFIIVAQAVVILWLA